jgi:serine/threonine-protein kinase
MSVLQPGLRVGDFTLLDPLGQGATGAVWRAHNASTDADVAVKFFAREEDAHGEVRERFEREARAAARIRWPARRPR